MDIKGRIKRNRNALQALILCALLLVFAAGLFLTATASAVAAENKETKKMKMNVDVKTLYLGNSSVSDRKSEYDFYIANKPKDWKKLYNFYWSSSSRKVAIVNGSGLVKAKGVGTAIITCVVTEKATGDVVVETQAEVIVYQNARAVSITGAPENQTVAVGEKVVFAAELIPKTGKDKVTDQVKWILTDNKAAAKIVQSTGTVTAQRTGSFTLTAYAYQSGVYPIKKQKDGTYTGYTAVSKPITITVVESAEEAAKADVKVTVTYDSYAEEIVDLVNMEREKAGLAPYAWDKNVQKAAEVRMEEIAIWFAHTRPDGRSCFTVIDDAGMEYQGLGENIAYGYAEPNDVMKGWMDSESHRANILHEEFDGIGVGYFVKDGRTYWVQIFIAY